MSVLLSSENFVKGLTNIDDNLQGSYLAPAIREVQDIDLPLILGSSLTDRLIQLVDEEIIEEPEYAEYKALLDKAQYYIAYQAIVKVILICSAKISNLGASQATDTNVRTLSLEETLKLQNIYQSKADAYAKSLQRYIIAHKSAFPELCDDDCSDIKAQLKSAASTGLFLGGARSRKLTTGKGGTCCGGSTHSGGGEGSVVSWAQDVTGGTKIATITIDGIPTQVYVPEGLTEEQVNALINASMAVETARTEDTYAKESELGNYVTTAETANFATTADTQDLDERLVDVENELVGKQDELTPGSGITISGNVISAEQYELEPATSNVLGGIKVGEGLSIDSGGTLSVSGDTGGGDYKIAASKSEITEPEYGQMYYVKANTEILGVYSGWSFDASNVNENYVATIRKIDGDDVVVQFYHNGDGFHWDWNNDGNFHQRDFDINGDTFVSFYASVDNHNVMNLVFPRRSEVYLEWLNENVTTSETTYTLSEEHPNTIYTVSDSAGTLSEIMAPTPIVLNFISESERVALYNELVAYRSYYNGVSEDFPYTKYAFYWYSDGSQGSGDDFKGFIPMQIVNVHPDDYEVGAIYFSGIEATRNMWGKQYVKANFNLINGGNFEQRIQTVSLLAEVAGSNLSDNGDTTYNADTGKWYRGEDEINVTGNTEGYTSSNDIDSQIMNGGKASDRLYNNTWKINIVSGGTTTSYWNPVAVRSDVTEFYVDDGNRNEAYNRVYSFIYAREDGTRFRIKFSTNGNQVATGFEFSEVVGYVVVDSLSDIANPTEGMVAYVKGNIAVNRLANVCAKYSSGWAGGLAQFAQGEDYTLYRGMIDTKWELPYHTNTPSIGYYWMELDANVYVRSQGGNLWVAWNSENFPNATMNGNNFNGYYNWGETTGQTFYITTEQCEQVNVYRGGKWWGTKKQYDFEDVVASTALSKEICDRASQGEMDITMTYGRDLMTCYESSPNTYQEGSTSFVCFRNDTANNQLQYFRKFVNWDSGYSWAQDAQWVYTLPQTSTVSISQADYDALVSGGTVDANTLYVIV